MATNGKLPVFFQGRVICRLLIVFFSVSVWVCVFFCSDVIVVACVNADCSLHGASNVVFFVVVTTVSVFAFCIFSASRFVLQREKIYAHAENGGRRRALLGAGAGRCRCRCRCRATCPPLRSRIFFLFLCLLPLFPALHRVCYSRYGSLIFCFCLDFLIFSYYRYVD